MRLNMFLCNRCNKNTPFIRKMDKLEDNIQHNYAECANCQYKATINYTDKHIRSLLGRQQRTKKPIKKIELSKQIDKECDTLYNKIKWGNNK